MRTLDSDCVVHCANSNIHVHVWGTFIMTNHKCAIQFYGWYLSITSGYAESSQVSCQEESCTKGWEGIQGYFVWLMV